MGKVWWSSWHWSWKNIEASEWWLRLICLLRPVFVSEAHWSGLQQWLFGILTLLWLVCGSWFWCRGGVPLHERWLVLLWDIFLFLTFHIFQGEGSAVNQVFFSNVPREMEIYKPGEIIKAKYILKYPHGTAERTGIKVYPYYGDIRICKLKITHIGRNYPCLRDPSLGPNTGQNSSTYTITTSNDKKYHQIDFMQIKNYGKYGNFLSGL